MKDNSFLESLVKKRQELDSRAYPKKKQIIKCKNLNGRESILRHLGYRSYTDYLNSYDLKTMNGKSIKSLVPLCFNCHNKIEFTNGQKNSLGEANRKLKGKINL